MKLSDIDLALIRRWCDRMPEHVRDQVRYEHRLRGKSVTLVERRVPWDAPGTPFGEEWTSQPLAQLRYDQGCWRLWWPDRNTRWHLIPDVPPAPTVGPLLDALDDPRRGLLG